GAAGGTAAESRGSAFVAVSNDQSHQAPCARGSRGVPRPDGGDRLRLPGAKDRRPHRACRSRPSAPPPCGAAHGWLVLLPGTARGHRAGARDSRTRALALRRVLLKRTPSKARRVARQACAFYLGLSHYQKSLRRLGFGDADLADGGSDRLIDALLAWGDEKDLAVGRGP